MKHRYTLRWVHFLNAHPNINRSASWEGSQNGVLGLKKSALTEISAVKDLLLWHFWVLLIGVTVFKYVVISLIRYHNWARNVTKWILVIVFKHCFNERIYLDTGYSLCMYCMPPYLGKKVKCTLVQARRLCTGCTVHRGSRGIAVLYRHWGSVQAVRSTGGVEV